jgi:hypothetical protein
MEARSEISLRPHSRVDTVPAPGSCAGHRTTARIRTWSARKAPSRQVCGELRGIAALASTCEPAVQCRASARVVRALRAPTSHRKLSAGVHEKIAPFGALVQGEVARSHINMPTPGNIDSPAITRVLVKGASVEAYGSSAGAPTFYEHTETCIGLVVFEGASGEFHGASIDIDTPALVVCIVVDKIRRVHDNP